MGYVIDTSAYSMAARGNAELQQLMSKANHLFIPATVLGELLYGFMQGNQYEANRQKLERFMASERVSLVPVTADTAARYAALRSEQRTTGYTVAPNDLWIAACCLQLKQPLLSLDTDFTRIPAMAGLVVGWG